MPYARHSHRRSVTVFWSREQDERLVELHELRAMTRAQIAHELSVTLRSLKYRTEELRRRGYRIPYPKRMTAAAPEPVAPKVRRRWTPDDDALLERMRNHGTPARAIAREIGVSSRAVYMRSHVLGLVKLRNRRTA